MVSSIDMNMIILFCAIVLIYVAIGFAFYRVMYRHEKKHHVRHIVMLAGTSLAAWWAASYFKNLIAFPRPDLTKALFLPLDIHSHGLPSGHAAFMFALASTMYSFDKKAGHALYALAIVTGIARVVAGVHFWYDILGGAVLGYAVSSVVVYMCKRLIRHW
jgi:membrane-associated phospholipid phosphatase